MSTPLDYFGEFEQVGVKVVVARYFYFDSEAYLYAARLREAGIKCFVSNSHAIAAVPLGNGGIGLHVRKEDLKSALQIFKEIEQQVPMEVDHREADLDDIEYERKLTEKGNTANFWLIGFVIIVAGLLVYRAFSRAVGWTETWWDFF